MMNHTQLLSLVIAAIFLTAACGGGATGLPQPSMTATTAQSTALHPDLVTAVPGNLLVRTRDDTRLFFTNVIGNLGVGRFQVRPVHEGATTVAYQQLLDASDRVVSEFPVSTYAYHPTHQHWHIDAVSEYTLREGALNGPIVRQATKVTFCMIDVELILPKDAAGTRHYTGCNADLQGITNGWGDEYFRALPDQSLPITGVPAGVYYLISATDPLNKFVEANDNNNVAWVKLQLSYVNGAPHITELDHSDCEGALCGGK